MANTDIKWYSSEDLNAPSLPADWNVLTDVLDACLINGYSSQSFSRVNISDGVAIATFNTNHSFKQFQVIEITGSENTTLNKEFKILGVSATTVEFLIDLPDAVYTGVMSARLAPLGWSKPFSDAGRGIYRAKNIEKNPFYLRVDGTKDPSYTTSHAKFAKVGILESCAGMNDLSGNQTPFNASDPNRNWVMSGGYSGWAKWKYAIGESASLDLAAQTVGNRKWFLVGNDHCFYLVIQASVGTSFEIPYGFGAVQTNGSPRPYLLSNLFYDQPGNNITATSALANPTLSLVSGMYDYTNTLINTSVFRLVTGFGNTLSGASTNTTKADPVTGYYLTPFYLLDPGNYILGSLPLVDCCINNALTELNGSVYSEDQVAYLLRRFSVKYNSSTTTGMLFFKIYEGS